jgi:dTDP-4-amino-4,6-dideoxygalactose transaminase
MLVDRKKDFIKYMKGKGIAVSQVHERNDLHSCMSEYRSMLPNLDKTIGSVVSIPVHWGLSKEEREYIVESIKTGW